MVKEAKYILVDLVGHNNNKFWNIELREDGAVISHWGRVGDPPRETHLGYGEKLFYKKIAEKEKKGYKPQQTISAISKREVIAKDTLANLAKKQIFTSCIETQLLVEQLAKANIHNILSNTTLAYDEAKGTFSTPLGVITQQAIDDARNLLVDISKFTNTKDYDNPLFAKAVSDYMMLVPTNIGREKPNLRILYPGDWVIKQKADILDSLEASLKLVLEKPPEEEVKEEPNLFNAKLELIEDRDIIENINRMFLETLNRSHYSAKLGVRKAYNIEIGSMRKSFNSSISNVQNLWHGTKVGNLLSILKSGFIIPPSNASYVCGRMYGNGVYFSDQSTKSLNYSGGWAPGQGGGNYTSYFMFLCKVAMGKSYIPMSYADRNNLPRPGYDSTFAKGSVSGVMNNEMIVYKTDQIDPYYLIEFT